MHFNRKHQKAQAAAGVKDRACSLELTKFYIAEVVVALEYLHNNVRRMRGGGIHPDRLSPRS